MRTLVFSIGNTSLTGGVWRNGKLSSRFRIPVSLGAREIVRRLSDRIRGPFDRAAYCSVVPALTGPVSRGIGRIAGIGIRRLDAGSAHGLRIGYRRPGELGADRVAAALGARIRFPGRDVVVVDGGTATTVTALGRDGAVRGGAILPGLGLWPSMLAARTAQLPEIDPRRPRSALGRSTAEGLAAGIWHGHVGAVRELVLRIRAEAFGRRRPVVVGTGGSARTLEGAGILSAEDPDLVLRGLWSFAESDVVSRR
jgi:type III pantothenate kinase